MVQSIPATEVTLRQLKESLNLEASQDSSFFPEWQISQTPVSEMEQVYLDRVKANFLDLLEDAPVLENSVKLVVLSPLLDLAGFYRRPYRLSTETSFEIQLEDEGSVIRGRLGILIVKIVFGWS